MSAQEAPQQFTECCGAAWDGPCKPGCINAREDMCRDCGQAHTEPGGCVPTCDLCGEPQEWGRMFGYEPDWNGETGNHITCEVTPMT